MDIKKYMQEVGLQSKESSFEIAKASSSKKNLFLNDLANRISRNEEEIIKVNHLDLDEAKRNNLDEAFVDRLTLNKKSIASMATGLLQIASLNDLIGEISNVKQMPSGIQVGKMRVPLGVIGMIYESRPNVTIDAAGLAIKSGNSIILRGGSESLASNNYLARLIEESLIVAGLPKHSVQIIKTKDRDAVTELIQMNSYVDVIIPRGGKSLVKKITEEARIPVIKHLDGNCHIYVDKYADMGTALSVVDNSKTQRLGTCNTLESLVISSSIAKDFLPKIREIFDGKNIEIRGCANTIKIVPGITKALESDFYEEYLGPTISSVIVENTEEAIAHINKYSSGHTESIITNNHSNAMQFLREIDSSSVMINASTRFADGFEYGLGAEIGISTDKFHARGPVGLEGLTSMKYIVLGTGQIRG
ncbi:MAG: glutamate-5-semialdehyde dehydrogenase [Nitrosomonadales bacterium]|jgi:glutamate-5-semialdehyde dehydrogenase|nr:MAG: gamma-glutamyl phosphate reductase [Methylophilales bacterium BACL14 MAG-120910-bin43]KRP07099.1 MAG: gamma-glutamyl phosphate reductase [Methylophilales bacterium BACL14 MAG-120920-bin58]MBT6392345.1 glutamate-5-semialdehyde dehydrogenase [Nitrosomonadales bacterium]|tara:strand:+ start:7170 stop:8426 length:1257 start_codon:yes stop_codon:yes gene_type:complete